MTVRSLSVAVVGAPYANKDGSSRTFEILLCTRGEFLELRPEPKNKYDEHAIAVLSVRGIQIGYVSSERAVFLSGLLRAGHVLFARFQDATEWGAVARVGVDDEPDMPTPAAVGPRDDQAGPDDNGFWPDYIPPDD